jgi:3-hydroxybutyryl-CoA dehydrogenase
MNQIGVVGLGIMGAGIVEVFASNGYQVIGVAESAEAVKQGSENLTTSINRANLKGKYTASEVKNLLSRILWTEDFHALSTCDLVIEAAPEVLNLKQEIFSRLDEIVNPKTILATNTSSLSVTEIAKSTKRPENVIGFHFFNPAPIQKFVEVISTEFTSPEVVLSTIKVGQDLKKVVAHVSDQPGFIVNKLLLVYINHATQILDLNRATRDDIDSAMREIANYPMGPLELADLIGIDTCVEILKTIAADSKNELHQPAAGLTKLLANGHKGRKSGQGFYNYSERPALPISENTQLKEVIHLELETAYLGSAVEMVTSGYASKVDIDNGMKLGCGLPSGPFEQIDLIGINQLRERQAKLAETSGRSEYAPLAL